MELDRNLLNRISELDEGKLRESIAKIASEMGMDERATSRVLSDMPKVRETVTSLTQSDLNRITSALGEEKANQLVESIRKEVKGNG